MRRGVLAGLLASLWLAPPAMAAGDPVRGERLHADCLQCHGTELYVPPKRRVRTYAELKKEVERWADHYNPKFTRQEIEDLVAYLERDFYLLSKRN